MSSHLPSVPDPSAESLTPHPLSGAPSPFEAPEEGGPPRGVPPLKRYMAALLRYKWIVLGATALGAAVGAMGMRFVEPEYLAQTTLWVETSRSGDMESGPIRSGELLESAAWIDLLRSFVVLDHVVRERRLYVRHSADDRALFSTLELKERFLPGKFKLSVDKDGKRFTLANGAGITLQQGNVGDSIGPAIGLGWLPARGALRPGREVEFEITTPRDAAIQLSNELLADLPKDGNFLRLELAGKNPEDVTATLNALADRYVAVAGDLKKVRLVERANILHEQLGSAAETLKNEEITLESFRVQTVTLPSDRGAPVAGGIAMTQNPVFENYFGLKMERDGLRRDREAIQRVLQQNTSGELSISALEAIPAVQRSSPLTLALKELTEKRASIRALANHYTEDYPPMRKLAGEIEALESQAIPALANRLVADLSARERELERSEATAGAQLQEIPPRAIEEARLERRIAIAENLYRTLQARYEEAQLAAATSSPDLRVLDKATVPHDPFKDPRYTVLFVAILGGLGLAVGGVLAWDRFDPRLRYPEQVSHEMGLTILGAVPDVSVKGPLKAEVTTHAMEAFRGIRLSLAHAYGAAGPLVVTVTSPGSGDGKSFVTSNLALSFADMGHRTLVIDGDTRRGVMHRLLGGTRKPGLLDYLAGNASREEIVQKTNYPSLHFIAGGTRMHNGPELLGSAGMAQLMAELRSSYSVILVDSPPLGAGVDPFILSTLTGNVLLTFRTGATEREFAGAKLDLLQRLPIRVLGAILNGVSAKEGAYRYYSYLAGYEALDEGAVEEAEEPKALQGV